MTSREAFRHVCRDGYWLWNIAPLGEIPDWREVAQPQQERKELFGYTYEAFLRKQYK